MTTKINAVDLSAKLLATENISVRRARTQTASFDVKSRVLTLPMWKEMSPVVEGMLVGHEVGHALYTTEDYFKPIQENPKIMGYLNILEDVRIEKLMKRKYPGIRKTMTEGYKELNEKDFFGVQKSDLNSMLLIDKINLYFKAGYACGVKFSIGEKNFVDRAERTETVDDVLELANEIYAYTREELRKQIEERKQELQLEGDGEDDEQDIDDMDGISGFSNPDYDEDEQGEQPEDSDSSGRYSSYGKSPEEIIEDQIDDQAESKTDKILTKKLEELADDKSDYIYHQLDENFIFDPVVPYKRIIEETVETEEAYADPEYGARQKDIYEKFKVSSSRVVNYLIKEFEMRKSATLYKRAQTSKIGQLDMRKVWSYKLNDDLFKRVTTIPQGKNHGMVFLLDWSGSMTDVMQETIEQVVTLAMFCHRAQIPYQVFAFSSQYDIFNTRDDREEYMKYNNARDAAREEREGKLCNALNSFAMLELMSSKMTNVEFNTMVRRLMCFWKFQRSKHHEYSLSGTPLNEALGYMLKHLPKFIAANNVEKLSFITLTDGEGGALYPCGSRSSRSNLEDHRYEYDQNNNYVKIKQHHFLQDPVTKKTYQFGRNSAVQTESIIRLIKDRFGVKTVGFYVTRNNRRNLECVLNSNIPGFNGSVYTFIENMRKDFRDHGFSSIKNSGRDDLFIIPVNSMRTEDAEVEVAEKHTAKQIARQFTKVMSGKKTSRVLLNQFIGYVA